MADFLIVDDELVARDAIKMRIESLGYTAIAVGDEDSMWEALRLEEPKGILLDVSLLSSQTNEINWRAGIDLAKELQKNYPEIPVVLFTARGDPFPEKAAKELPNVRAFFRKPMPSLALREALQAIVEERSK